MPRVRRAPTQPRLKRARLGSRRLFGAPEVPKTVSGLRLWLAARKEIGYADTNGVATPINWSGLGNILTQATGSKQPTYRTAVLDGQPVFRFTLASAQLWAASAGDIVAATNGASGLTLFVVAKVAAFAGVSQEFLNFDTNTVNTARFKFGYRAGGAVDWFAVGRRLDADTQTNADSTIATDTNWHLHTCTPDWANAEVKFYREQTLDSTIGWTSAGTVSATNSANVSVGAKVNNTEFLDGDIAEMLVYDRVLAAGERQAVWDYLLGIYPSLAATGTNAPAEAATGTGVALDAQAAVTVNAEAATGTGTAPDPTPAAGANAEAASGTGSSLDAQATVTVNAEAASGTGAAPDPTPAVTVNAEAASGTGVALDATVSTTNATNAPAEAATGTGSALDAIAAVDANAGVATGTGAANNTGIAVAANAETATGVGKAEYDIYDPGYDPGYVSEGAQVAIGVNVGAATGTGTSFDATVSTAAITNAPAEAATGTGAANDAAVAITVPAGVATGTGTANNATVQVGREAPAEVAAGTGSAPDATVAIAVSAEAATGTGAALDATVAFTIFPSVPRGWVLLGTPDGRVALSGAAGTVILDDAEGKVTVG
jgi:hypothetical protein